MKAKHTKEFAEKIGRKKYPYSPNMDKRKLFIEGFMTAIEETNHIEVLEALKTSTKWLKLIISLPIKQDIRDAIEVGIKLNNEAIRKAEEELNQSKDA